jgi:hypothetical protein
LKFILKAVGVIVVFFIWPLPLPWWIPWIVIFVIVILVIIFWIEVRRPGWG